MTSTDEFVAAWARRAGQRRSGVIVGLREPSGRRVIHAAGRKDRPHEHSAFEIGSITKVFTAILLADLAVRGIVTLDQPVRELLPEDVTVPRWTDGAEITLEQLATHTSGLPLSPLHGLRPRIEHHLMNKDPYARLTSDGLLEELGRSKLRRRPGSGPMHYSNLGYGVLGLALLRAAGADDYLSLLVERICLPLGMTETGRAPTDGTMLRGHRWGDREADRWVLDGIAGAGGLVSTVTDLLTFLTAQLDPADTPLADAIALTHVQKLGGRLGMGLGWMRFPEPYVLFWHNGGTGGFRSFIGFRPQRGDAVAVLANHSRSVDLVAVGVLRDIDDVTGGLAARGEAE